VPDFTHVALLVLPPASWPPVPPSGPPSARDPFGPHHHITPSGGTVAGQAGRIDLFDAGRFLDSVLQSYPGR
jgi:hypothetical protein